MNILVALLCLLGTSPIANAQTNTSTVYSNLFIAGVMHKDARIEKLNPATAKIWHSSGVATVPITALPDLFQTQLNYSPAQAFQKLHAQQQAILQLQKAAEAAE
jgi:hypothetical protein